MSPAEQQAYRRGVLDVLALVSATAAHIESGELPTLRRELAVATLKAVAQEARALLTHAPEGSGQ